ncbi:putative U3 small nucleolar RNA-associated protein 7 [Microbotryomycetes sp. JL221]|nr:putative U3 small nucleolar RNA-associated protein 7 [Microbotryomycetes sp. JL221]
MTEPIASTSNLTPQDHTRSSSSKGKHKQQQMTTRNADLPEQPEYVPPAQNIKKYMYSKPAMQNKNFVSRQAIKHNNKDKRLAHHLQHLSSTAKASSTKAYEHDNLLLPQDNYGLIEPETELERTWKVTQNDIKQSSAIGAASKSFDLSLPEFGPYAVDYTRNGRHLAIVGRKGHVGTFDWQSGKLHTEIQLRETCRSIKWLHDESFFAVAQKKYVYIYDKDGLEVHQLKDHVEVTQMEFLPYHFLLATVGNAGFLKYQDTSTGQLVAQHRTKLGGCQTMAQNAHNAFINLGHQNGTVTLWSPSVSSAQVQLLAHRGPVTAIACDPSTMGTRMVTAGLDGTVKVWDTRKWQVLNEFMFKKTPTSVSFSQKGLLGLGWGNHVSVFKDLQKPGQNPRMPPPPYMTHTFPSTSVSSIRFCPFEDVLGVGHASGFSSLIIPGSGESNFDTLEADPFEGKRRKREREVNSLLDKLPFDMITLDPNLVGQLDSKIKHGHDVEQEKRDRGLPGFKETNFRNKTRLDRLKQQGKAQLDEDESSDEDEDQDDKIKRERRLAREAKQDNKNRARGRNSSLKKMLRKRKRNVIDPQTVAIKEKMAKQRQQAKTNKQNALLAKSQASGTAGALDRFKF